MINVVAFELFAKEAKRLCKKFNSLQSEIGDLVKELKKNPELGTSLGSGLFKIRLASLSKTKGKIGGFRVITYFVKSTSEGNTLYLVSIYDKSEEVNIPKSVLMELVKKSL